MKVRKRGKRDEFNDLDCPLRLGDTLILVETKGQLLQYPAEVWDRAAVEMRWEANVRFIRKIDETARVVAERHQDEGYRESMRGITRIFALVCRPHPEWIADSDDYYWLRKPSEDDAGVPRILTPEELREFLEDEDLDLANLSGAYMVEVE